MAEFSKKISETFKHCKWNMIGHNLCRPISNVCLITYNEIQRECRKEVKIGFNFLLNFVVNIIAVVETFR